MAIRNTKKTERKVSGKKITGKASSGKMPAKKTKVRVLSSAKADGEQTYGINPKVNFYFAKAGKWQQELKELRSIALGCGLTEELKWGVPCYTYEGNNIVLIHVFKEYFALLFFKGALLKDKDGILVQQTKNVQAARQMRFTNLEEINKRRGSIKNYIYEAIELEKAGAKVAFKKTAEFSMPMEFKNRLDENSSLKKAFNGLTPGRQRAYLLYFSAAKQTKTREARIEKYVQAILNGKGLND